MYTLVGAIAGLEVEVGSPVVGKVLGELASRASRRVGHVAGRHGGVEAIAADNLVDVRRGDGSRVDQRVETVNDELGASEPQHRQPAAAAELGHGIGERGEKRKEGSAIHVDSTLLKNEKTG